MEHIINLIDDDNEDRSEPTVATLPLTHDASAFKTKRQTTSTTTPSTSTTTSIVDLTSETTEITNRQDDGYDGHNNKTMGTLHEKNDEVEYLGTTTSYSIHQSFAATANPDHAMMPQSPHYTAATAAATAATSSRKRSRHGDTNDSQPSSTVSHGVRDDMSDITYDDDGFASNGNSNFIDLVQVENDTRLFGRTFHEIFPVTTLQERRTPPSPPAAAETRVTAPRPYYNMEREPPRTRDNVMNEREQFFLEINPETPQHRWTLSPPAAAAHVESEPTATNNNVTNFWEPYFGNWREMVELYEEYAGGGSKRRRATKRRATKPPPPPPLLPMQKGKAKAVPTGFDALDMYYPQLKAAERTAVLRHLLSARGFTFLKKWAHSWRVNFEKNRGPKSTLWDMVAALSDEITTGTSYQNKDDKPGEEVEGYKSDDDRKMPAKYRTTSFPPILFSEDTLSSDKKAAPETLPIGPLKGEVLDTLQAYFRAHVDRTRHRALLDAIEPVVDTGGGALACGICADAYNPSNVIPCCSEGELHFFCKPCFVSYATITVQAGPIQGIACPVPKCNSVFATADVKSTLSDWDILMIERRETNRDRRVALAGRAVLHCECGAVGIVTDSEIGDGRVQCPGCGLCYCCKCGNYDHGADLCPPPAETVQWLDKNSKECPNCKNRIEKNGGCDHMTCRPPGGCGHDFWWTCGCPYKGHIPPCRKAHAASIRY